MIELKELFTIVYGNQLDLNKQEVIINGINFVNRSANNLGISCKIKELSNIKPFAKELISVSLGGSILESFVQPAPFYTGQNVKVLTPKQHLTYREKLFYCFCIKSNAYRYGAFGREANKTLDEIKIPSPDEIPSYVNQIVIKKITNKPYFQNKINLNNREWKMFLYSNFFSIRGTKTTPINALEEYSYGRHPYVTTKATNNGVDGFFDYHTEKGNILTIDSAVVGFCSYQDKCFSASDYVEKLIPKFKMNKYIAMFLQTIINQEHYRYSYGRKRSQKRLCNEYIKLPIDENIQPDWQFMEDYIKSLPYSSNL